MLQAGKGNPRRRTRDETPTPAIDTLPAYAGPSRHGSGRNGCSYGAVRATRPLRSASDIRRAQARFEAPADTTPFSLKATATPRRAEVFLSGLRHARKEGEIRPTSRKKPQLPPRRRRPDPLQKILGDLKPWFDEDPSQTGQQVRCRHQAHIWPVLTSCCVPSSGT